MADPEDLARARFTLSQATEPGTVVLRLGGELDVSNVELIRPQLAEIVDQRADRIVIDMSALTFMDSSGIALFVEAAQKVTIELRESFACYSTDPL